MKTLLSIGLSLSSSASTIFLMTWSWRDYPAHSWHLLYLEHLCASNHSSHVSSFTFSYANSLPTAFTSSCPCPWSCSIKRNSWVPCYKIIACSWTLKFNWCTLTLQHVWTFRIQMTCILDSYRVHDINISIAKGLIYILYCNS